jgi:hypothetical protein
VLSETIAIYRQSKSGSKLEDLNTRRGRLLQVEKTAIVDVMNDNQATINAQGTGFKGFIPAVFARLVSESFSRKAQGEAQMKVTAPQDLIRNRRSRPDAWEDQGIRSKFLTGTWPRGAPYFESMRTEQGQQFRIMVPEYYDSSCLSCHGGPKGSLDITGYPREGAKMGDLGGVISIKLSH